MRKPLLSLVAVLGLAACATEPMLGPPPPPPSGPAAVAIAAQDVRITMPPFPWRFDGPDSIRPLMADAASMGDWRLVPVGANRMPAAASYLRRPGDTQFRAFKLDVMRIEAGMIVEITTFNAELFTAFGLVVATFIFLTGFAVALTGHAH